MRQALCYILYKHDLEAFLPPPHGGRTGRELKLEGLRDLSKVTQLFHGRAERSLSPVCLGNVTWACRC